jgi:hypothetical protein
MIDPRLEALRADFVYDPDSGLLHRVNGRKAFVTQDTHGYLQGRVAGVLVLAHRAAWALHHGEWPNGQIDHINGNRTDNRIDNLRVVSATENARNATLRADNRSGVPGVGWHSRYKKWTARIGVQGRQKTIGYYATLAEAAAARRVAETEQGYHRNHGRVS